MNFFKPKTFPENRTSNSQTRDLRYFILFLRDIELASGLRSISFSVKSLSYFNLTSSWLYCAKASLFIILSIHLSKIDAKFPKIWLKKLYFGLISKLFLIGLIWRSSGLRDSDSASFLESSLPIYGLGNV